MSRRRWVYTQNGKPCEPYEVDVSSWSQPASRVELMTGSFYADARATDGTPIDTRARHREYMRKTDSAMASDFKETIQTAQRARQRELSGEPTQETRRAVEAAWVEVERHGR